MQNILSVSQLNFYVKSLLDNDMHLGSVFISGEISNLKDHYSSGHIYMSLKDEKSVISAVMFAGYARTLRFKPENGMKIIARGRVTLYEATGQYQLYIEDMQPDGAGSLAIAFEQLKNKLQSQGLFDASHKKKIPKFPKSIAVITSPTGAAIADIKNILFRRYPNIDVIVCPVLVQGENAPKQLTEMVNLVSRYKAADVIIIGRGGGSAENLWAFNSEELAYAIYDCTVPVISAVGHETDFTICDFVSDLRAPTPSAAAELAVPDREELLQNLYAQKQYIDSLTDRKLTQLSKTLKILSTRINAVSPLYKLNMFEKKLDLTSSKINALMQNKLREKSEKLTSLSSKLEALNPISVLSRGYSMATVSDKIVRSVNDVSKNDVITVHLKDGCVTATVTDVANNE